MKKNKSKIVLVNILLLVILLNMSFCKDNVPLKYYYLSIKFDEAVFTYNNKNDILSKNLFKEIIKADSFNYYWESNIYLSNLYMKLGFPDSSENIIERSIDQNIFCSSHAEQMLMVAKYAIKINRYIELDSTETYNDILNEIYPFPINTWGDVPPEPIIGFEKYNEYINDIVNETLSPDKINNKIYIDITINHKGVVGRVKIHGIEKNRNDDKLLLAIYRSKWKPGFSKNTPKGWAIRLPVQFKSN